MKSEGKCYHCGKRKPLYYLSDTDLEGLCEYCLDNLLDSFAQSCVHYHGHLGPGCRGGCYFFKDEPTQPPHCYEPEVF